MAGEDQLGAALAQVYLSGWGSLTCVSQAGGYFEVRWYWGLSDQVCQSGSPGSSCGLAQDGQKEAKELALPGSPQGHVRDIWGSCLVTCEGTGRA